MGSSTKGQTVSGQVKTVEEQKAEEKRMAIREQNRMTIAGAIFSRLSRLPFVNVWLEKQVSTSRKVVREETGLFDDLVKHDESFNRLLNIDVLNRADDAKYEADAVAAENRLAAEKRIAEARETDDAIYRKNKEREEAEADMKNKYDLQILEANYKIQLDPLAKAVKKFEKPEPEREPKKKTTRGRSEKQKLREDVLTRYEKEIARIEASKKSAKAKADLKKAAEKEREDAMAKIENEP
jgi:hypothetical protein